MGGAILCKKCVNPDFFPAYASRNALALLFQRHYSPSSDYDMNNHSINPILEKFGKNFFLSSNIFDIQFLDFSQTY